MIARLIGASSIAAVSLLVLHAEPSRLDAGAARAERSILVTVLDENGAPLRNLTTADFMVHEDGAPCEVTDAHLTTDRLFVALLVDTGEPPRGTMPTVQDLRAGLSAFVTTLHQADPGAEIEIYEIAGAAVRTVNFTSSVPTLDKWIERIFPSQRAGAVLLESIIAATKDLRNRQSLRRTIVAVTLASPETSTVQPRAVGEAVHTSLTSYWTVSIEPPTDSTTAMTVGRSSDPALIAVRELIQTYLPLASGGRHLTAVTATALAPLLRQVATALTVQYVVTYARPEGRAPKVIQAGARYGATVLMAPWIE